MGNAGFVQVSAAMVRKKALAGVSCERAMHPSNSAIEALQVQRQALLHYIGQ